jgi:hypothetical protein
MAKTVIGLMDNIREAQHVVKDLVARGIERDDIGFMANEKHTVPDSAHLNESEGSRTTSGAFAGAGTGAAVGGIAGLALSLAPLAIPGIGPILAAGPIAAALTGAGIGAVAGGLIGGLTNLGVPEDEAHYYAEGVRRGGILVTVAAETEAQADQAAEVMRSHGAVDIDERATEWKKQGWKGRFEADTMEGERTVEQGGVRVSSHVREQPARETMDLEAAQASDAAFREQSFEMQERAEEPVIEKRARVVEEVKLGKRRQKKAQTRYSGPERRLSGAPYNGIERRRAA